MASEDSRNRDGFRWFIVDAITAISARPLTVRWACSLIMRTTFANDLKSPDFAVLNGFSSKNGMM